MSTTTNTSGIDTKGLIKWIITILATATILIGFKDSTFLDAAQTKFFAATLFFILVTAFELLPNMLIAILLPMTYLYFNLATAAVIFNSWSNNIIWMCTCGMLAANILSRIGLLKRVVVWCVKKIGYSYRRLVFAFGIAGIILAIVSPSGGYLVLAAVVYSFCKILNLEGTKTGAGIMLSATLMVGIGFVYAPSSHGMMASLVNTIVPDFTMDYVSFFIHQIPIAIFYFVPLILIPIVFKQDAPIDEKLISEEVQSLGAMGKEEKKATVLTLLFVAAIFTTSIHKIGLQYIFVVFVTSFFVPGIAIGTQKDIRSVNYPLIFFIASFISIGSVASALNFNPVVSRILSPMLSSGSALIMCMSVYAFGIIGNFLMTPLAAIAAFTTALTQVTVDLGIPLYPVLYSFLGGLNEPLLPYEMAKCLVFYAYGMFTIKDFMKIFGIRMVLHAIWIPVLLVPYWNLIGLT